jgi:hypothetical protein
MFITREEVEKLKDILDKFPNVKTLELHQDTSSGIGSYTYVSFAQEINGYRGSFQVEISGVENW